MRLARLYLIRGRVQGVGFRYFAWQAAVGEGLHGWVRNLPGGEVEVLAEGEPDALGRFEERIRSGPPAARVDSITVVDRTPGGQGGDFTIR